ncbi:hypothetical protein PF005_g13061 [Phytophthora fragariae]|uniref:Pectate lyase n=1 Tax=Phytophthora fragariae TaxID=53985 RepID=A0A6A3XZI9_9STRA|nr:hypothetical protein PF010_g13240 [Phytophthora fragariae]KAE9206300.1 hypothetical protein PF005_g13061 [Phytophthora fragariae]
MNAFKLAVVTYVVLWDCYFLANTSVKNTARCKIKGSPLFVEPPRGCYAERAIPVDVDLLIAGSTNLPVIRATRSLPKKVRIRTR